MHKSNFDENFLCECEGCGNTAHVFGLAGNVKKRRCEQHILDLTRKKMQIYDISAYSFISSSEDAARCEGRRKLVEAGMKNVALLESGCMQEMEAAMREIGESRGRTVQVVEMCFNEIEERLKSRYKEVKNQLSEMKAKLQGYMYDQETDLTDCEKLIWRRMDFEPKVLQFALGDVQVPVVKLVLSEFALAPNGLEMVLQCTNPAKRQEFIASALRDCEVHLAKGRTGLANELLAYAKALGHRDPKSDVTAMDSEKPGLVARELVQLLPAAIDLNTVKAAATSYLQEGVSERASAHYPESLAFFQTAWSLLESKEVEDSDRALAGVEFGHTLSFHFALYPEAETILKESLEIERKLRYGSKEDLALVSELMAGHYLGGKYELAEQDGLGIVHSYSEYWEGTWTSALYLVWAYREQGKNSECEAIAASWQQRLTDCDTKYAKFIAFCLLAERETQCGNVNSAENLYLKAQKAAYEQFSPSIIETEVNRQLGTLYCRAGNLESALVSYTKALELYELHYPSCMQAADTARAVCNVYVQKEEMEVAREFYSKADSIYCAYYPKSTQNAENCRDFARFYGKTGKFPKAESLLASAKAIYSENDSKMGLAACSFDLGQLYESKGELETALTHVTEAWNLWKEQKDEKSALTAQLKVEKIKAALTPSSIFSLFSSIFRK